MNEKRRSGENKVAFFSKSHVPTRRNESMEEQGIRPVIDIETNIGSRTVT